MPWSPVYPMADAPLPPRPGLYKVILATDGAFAGTALAGLGVGSPLYVGRAEESLYGRDVRPHLASNRTGSSILRRSLGAVLHDVLRLKARPRQDRWVANYRFDPEGEARLTAWMQANLSVSWLECASAAEAKHREPGLIFETAPVLNLQHHPRGPWEAAVPGLRDRCREEAQRDLGTSAGGGVPRG